MFSAGAIMTPSYILLLLLLSPIRGVVSSCERHGYVDYRLYTRNMDDGTGQRSLTVQGDQDKDLIDLEPTLDPNRTGLWEMQFYECYNYIYYSLNNRKSEIFLGRKPTTDLVDPALERGIIEVRTSGAAPNPDDSRLFPYLFHDFIQGYLRLSPNTFLNYGLQSSSFTTLWQFLPVIEYMGMTVEPFVAQLSECISHSFADLSLDTIFTLQYNTEPGQNGSDLQITTDITAYELGRRCGKLQRKRRAILPDYDEEACPATPVVLSCPCSLLPNCSCDLEFLYFTVTDRSTISSDGMGSRTKRQAQELTETYTAVAIRIPGTELYLEGAEVRPISEQILSENQSIESLIQAGIDHNLVKFKEFPVIRQPHPLIFTQSGMAIHLQRHVDRRFYRVHEEGDRIKLESVLQPGKFLAFFKNSRGTLDLLIADEEQTIASEVGDVLFTFDLNLIPGPEFTETDPLIEERMARERNFTNFVNDTDLVEENETSQATLNSGEFIQTESSGLVGEFEATTFGGEFIPTEPSGLVGEFEATTFSGEFIPTEPSGLVGEFEAATFNGEFIPTESSGLSGEFEATTFGREFIPTESSGLGGDIEATTLGREFIPTESSGLGAEFETTTFG